MLALAVKQENTSFPPIVQKPGTCSLMTSISSATVCVACNKQDRKYIKMRVEFKAALILICHFNDLKCMSELFMYTAAHQQIAVHTPYSQWECLMDVSNTLCLTDI